ncbi:MAG: aspartate aminotransferase family protein [Desulfobacter sp.]|nr:MAG: aspartate aminotransferase family protein [Desulfobacter sp.]
MKPVTLPDQGRSFDTVLDDLKTFGLDDPDYKNGKTWSLVYYRDEEYSNFLNEAGRLFASTNGLNPMAFKSLKRMEAEVVQMTAALLNGDEGACGIMTSGGTESCLLAVKTYRDMARKTKKIKKPEMIIPESAHVAWEKGAQYFDVKPVRIPLGEDFRVDIHAVERAVTKNTVMILGSAPGYPHGVVDDIEYLGDLAVENNIPLHVDACVGGYLLPFVEKLGYHISPFDFRVPGVTSISADTHKYGYAAKGASTLLYRDMEYMAHQFFISTEWPGGVFASPGILGTRPGGAVAAAWAAMQAMGRDGYLDHARIIMDTAAALIRGINAIEGLEVLGRPEAGLFAYRSTDKGLNIYAVGDRMEEKGWHIDRQQKPESLHAMVTPLHHKMTNQYLGDLKESVEKIRANPELGLSGSAATYGMVSKVPMRKMVKKNVLDIMKQSYGPGGMSLDLNAQDGKYAGWAEKLGRLFLRFRS